MGSSHVASVAAIGTVVSFAYISESLDRHSLSGHPRVSALLVLLLSAGICFIASNFTKWLPGGEGRFTAQERHPDRPEEQGGILHKNVTDAPNRTNAALVPGRPKRWSLPALIVCIVVRLELFNRIAHQQQCATNGVEALICPLLFAYEVYGMRRRYGVTIVADLDDPWRTIFDDIYDWFSGPWVATVIAGTGVMNFSLGTSYAVGHYYPSTYFCFEPLDSRAGVLASQMVGVAIDAAIMILVWRILAWSRTIKQRARTLASILATSAVCVGFMWMGARVLEGETHFTAAFGPLYGFDILVDAVGFAILAMCATTWICETSPLLPSSTMSVLVGLWASWINLRKLGDWAHLNTSPVVWPPWILAAGFVLFMRYQGLQRLFHVRRILISLSLLIFAITVAVKASKRGFPSYERHPLSDLIYKASHQHDQWLREASISGSLKVAARIYEERHPGMHPPPNFDQWYNTARGSAIIDSFDQIDNDLSPYWNFKPDVLRKRADLMAEMPGASVITIKDGKVTHNNPGDDQGDIDLEELTGIIGKFSAHLPDMVLPVNLDPSPQILPTWEEAHGQGQAELSAVAELITKRSLEAESNSTSPVLEMREGTPVTTTLGPELSVNDFREMLVQGCPPASRVRTRNNWNIAEFCDQCVKDHSKHAFLIDWHKSLDTCQQPDLKNLHDHFMTSPTKQPIRKLMPLFSLSKTEHYKDILIPLPRATFSEPPDVDSDFFERFDSFFWRGQVGPEAAIHPLSLRGSQRYRLLHLFVDPSPQDKVTICLPFEHHKDRFGYERVPTEKASLVAPFDMGLNGFEKCHGRNCDILKEAFGNKEEVAEPLDYRYVLQLDEGHAPPPQLMRTLRSGSVPFVSTIFRSWYTERLRAYLHFVPIDPRYHSLHSTYMYFTGTQDREKINGRDTNMKDPHKDGQYIAHEGRKWAAKAIGEKDIEVYLFRLLLEWGRLIDDKRDSIGFQMTDKGEPSNVGWTKRDSI